MGEIVVIGMDVRVASRTTFIAGADPKKNHAIVTVINNRGINQTTKLPMQDECTLNFWGKYAGVAAFYLYPGKQINFRGRMQSYTTDTGTVNAAGKKILNRKNEVVVDSMQLLGDSLKEINRRLALNSTVLKNAGRMQAHEVFSAEELLRNPENIPLADYNPAIAAVTGLYGKARVWVKGIGFLDQKLGTVAQTTTGTVGKIDTPESLAAELIALQARIAGMAKPTEVPAPAPEMIMEADVIEADIAAAAGADELFPKE